MTILSAVHEIATPPSEARDDRIYCRTETIDVRYNAEKKILSGEAFKKGLKILKATVAVSSNRKALLPSFPLSIEVKSLLTDFKEVEEIPYSLKADGAISIIDIPDKEPFYQLSGTKATFKGPFVELNRKASDLRFSFWGNQGFLYRFILCLLEKKHLIYNLHACALYQAECNRLFIIAGGAGSGKTIYLLSGLEKGLTLFSTETVHFKKEGSRFRWFMGSLVDNVRLGTLRNHFPRFLTSSSSSNVENEWREKIAVDLSSHKCREETLVAPEVIILFPRIEEGRDAFILNPIEDSERAVKALFDNISEKLAETCLLYDRLPLLSLDRPELAEARLQATRELIRHKSTVFCATVLSSPRHCWGGLLKRGFEKGDKHG